MRELARLREARDGRAAVGVVVAAAPVGVVDDGRAADDVERERLRGEARAGGDADHALDHFRVAHGKRQRLHAAEASAHDGVDAPDAELPQEERVDLHDVADGHVGEPRAVGAAAVGGVRRRRAGRALAAAEDVGADDVEAVGVDAAPGADHVVPPAGGALHVVGRVSGGVRVAGEGVADEDDVVALRRELAVCLVGDVDARERASGLEPEAALGQIKGEVARLREPDAAPPLRVVCPV